MHRCLTAITLGMWLVLMALTMTDTTVSLAKIQRAISNTSATTADIKDMTTIILERLQEIKEN